MSAWTNSFLTFRLRPADENQWLERVEEALTSIVHAEPVASHMIRYNNGVCGVPGWPWRDRNVLAAVVLEALIHSQRERVHYSRDNFNACVAYPAMTDEFNTRRIAKIVDWLADQGLVHSHRVTPGAKNKHCSSFMALPKLRAMLRVPVLRAQPDDSIWLRDEYGRRKLVPDTPEVRRMRERRDAHNALMAGAIAWYSPWLSTAHQTQRSAINCSNVLRSRGYMASCA
jgi:hypothetical protein